MPEIDWGGSPRLPADSLCDLNFLICDIGTKIIWTSRACEEQGGRYRSGLLKQSLALSNHRLFPHRAPIFSSIAAVRLSEALHKMRCHFMEMVHIKILLSIFKYYHHFFSLLGQSLM